MSDRSSAAGSASILIVAALTAMLIGVALLAALGAAVGRAEDLQRAADLAALAGGHAMLDAYPRLFEPATVDGAPNPRHLSRTAYVAAAVARARAVARANGAEDVEVGVPDGGSFAPLHVRVVTRTTLAGRERKAPLRALAEAELIPDGDALVARGGYAGPLALRQGKPMRPDVARAFDRMDRAARADGVALVIASAFRSDAEQARLFAAHPDPRWVARPGTSLHRLGTELDLGPAAAYSWLRANGARFGFVQRYAWEPWHWGYRRAAGSRSVGFGPPDGRDSRGMPAFVPAALAPVIARAAMRWNVGAALLAAQLYAESNFNPFAVSGAGAAGIAQFMPGTARAYGVADPFDVRDAIDGQAHLMHDLLRQFGSVPLALAAYNAGPGAVASCGCIPPIPETRGYVARILGLLGGAGDLAAGGLEVRLVR